MSVLEEVGEELEQAATAAITGHGRLLGIEPLEAKEGAYSRVLRLRLRFERRQLAVSLKIHRRETPGFHEQCLVWAEKEFTILDVLCNASNERRGVTVVRPLLFLPKLPGILMETHPGPLLTSALGRRRFGMPGLGDSSKQLAAHYFMAGRTLREMQKITLEDERARGAVMRFPPGEIKARQVLRQADDFMSNALRLCPSKERESGRKIYEASRSDFAALVDGHYPSVGVHGDYTPANMFIGASRITLFDLVNFHLGHPFLDVGQFLSYTYFLQKDSWSYRRSDVTALIQAFMDGYELSDWRVNRSLGFFFQVNMFRTLCGAFRFQKKRWPIGAIYKTIMLRLFRRWVHGGMRLPSG